MVGQIEEVDFSASIATGANLAVLDTDKSGVDRYLIGVRGVLADMQRWRISADGWGNRALEGSPIGAPGTAAGSGLQMLSNPMFVGQNKTVTLEATQDSGIAQIETVSLLFAEGDVLASIIARKADLHTIYVTGTAQNGDYPSRSTPTDTIQILNELDNELWLPLWATVIGTGSPRAKFAHSKDDGKPPVVYGVNDRGLGPYSIQPVDPMAPLAGGDDLKFLGQDQSGSTIEGWLTVARVTGGRTVLFPEWFHTP